MLNHVSHEHPPPEHKIYDEKDRGAEQVHLEADVA